MEVIEGREAARMAFPFRRARVLGGANKLRLHVQRRRTRNNNRGEGPFFPVSPNHDFLDGDSLLPFPPAYQFDQTIALTRRSRKLPSTCSPVHVQCQMADSPTGGLACHGEDGRVDGGKGEVSVWLVTEWPVEVA